MSYFVYLLASKKNGTLYVGVTGDLKKRVWEHNNDFVEGFSKKYRVHNLVYFEEHTNVKQAILRVKQIKRWKRYWKIKLIDQMNPNWDDLFEKII